MYLYEVARFARNVQHASELYLALGLSVIPLKGKRPAIQWSEYQVSPPSLVTLYGWSSSSLMENVGIVCGKVSHHLVVVDLDGMGAVQTFKSAFPKLLQTYTVLTGSGKGLHLYYYVKDLPESTRLTLPGKGNIEVRADGCQIVAPPSVHPITQQLYKNRNLLPVMHLEDLNEVTRWLKQRQQMMRPMRKAYVTAPVRNGSAYGLRALHGECDKVQQSMEGNGNNQLNRSAFRLGQLVAVGHLSQSEVEQALCRAAAGLSARDGETATLRTIQSGLSAGMNNPRH